ncbi:hypothetical protein BT96DRAFT_158384 [Gymnopus androsaceus JB14]|uniref:Uncharacterized protein n=1 Tax=Gymnopus androsaceus JB14 TaxID=1447944 RepID=A0A6A4HAE0_9AGAR|nr:hypothetical protein BT96DRAFT_158384 [Gymnopus androsaceus JB14]
MLNSSRLLRFKTFYHLSDEFPQRSFARYWNSHIRLIGISLSLYLTFVKCVWLGERSLMLTLDSGQHYTFHNNSGRKRLKKEVVWVNEWISRSRGLPLDLHFHFELEDRLVDTSAITQVMEYAVNHSHQIRLLNLWGPKTVAWSAASIYLPALKSLCLRCLEMSPGGRNFISCLTAPFLERLTLYQLDQNLGGPLRRCV